MKSRSARRRPAGAWTAIARGVAISIGLATRGLTMAAAADAEGTARRGARAKAPLALAAGDARGLARTRAGKGPGHVQFITGLRAYIDRGKADGLVEGQYLEMLRGGRFVGRCTIEHLGDHTTVCRGAAIRVGDTFRRAQHLRAAPERDPEVLPPPVDAATLDDRTRALGAIPFQKVGFTPRDRDGTAPTIRVEVGTAGWSGGRFASGSGGSLEEHVDGRIQRFRLGDSDLRFDLAFTALRWQRRPEPSRFLPTARTELFVWQAEVSRRELDDRTVLALGRLWPRHVPGLAMLDGLQVGRRNEAGSGEAGVYGGTEPTDAALVPTVSNWAAGAYGVLTAASPRGGAAPSATIESRIGLRRAPVGGALREGELLGQLWARSWGLGGGARVVSTPNHAMPKVELAHLHLRAGDREPIGGWMELRYLGPTSVDQTAPSGEQPSGAGAYHGALGAHVDLTRVVGLGLLADAHRDSATGARALDGTLELRLPRLFSDAGGMWLAVTATEGWVRGRGAYLQYLGAPVGATRVFARVTARTTRFDVANALPDLTEIDGYLHVDAPVTARLRLRGHSSVFVPIAVQGQAPVPPRLSYLFGADAVALF
jgi:hypothetical protein